MQVLVHEDRLSSVVPPSFRQLRLVSFRNDRENVAVADTSARMLRLLSLLQSRRDWSGSDLADRLGVSARTLRSDITRLRALGYPVEARPGVAGGYRLGSGAALSPLLLDDEEAVAVAVSLATSAGSSVTGIEDASMRALAKLRQVLPSRLRGRVAALGASALEVAPGGPTVDPQLLSELALACRDLVTLRFDYRSHDGTESRRTAEPYRLLHRRGRWYLFAFDVDRADWRVFRADASPSVRRADGASIRDHSPMRTRSPRGWAAASTRAPGVTALGSLSTLQRRTYAGACRCLSTWNRSARTSARSSPAPMTRCRWRCTSGSWAPTSPSTTSPSSAARRWPWPTGTAALRVAETGHAGMRLAGWLLAGWQLAGGGPGQRDVTRTLSHRAGPAGRVAGPVAGGGCGIRTREGC
jgi:predicted DNA-binding transcriptional regulator YafY